MFLGEAFRRSIGRSIFFLNSIVGVYLVKLSGLYYLFCFNVRLSLVYFSKCYYEWCCSFYSFIMLGRMKFLPKNKLKVGNVLEDPDVCWHRDCGHLLCSLYGGILSFNSSFSYTRHYFLWVDLELPVVGILLISVSGVILYAATFQFQIYFAVV